jgi:hypothetical protein
MITFNNRSPISFQKGQLLKINVEKGKNVEYLDNIPGPDAFVPTKLEQDTCN